jgi:two-component system, NtrC family, nitrogen regulation sensor histidine kinase GlnL
MPLDPESLTLIDQLSTGVAVLDQENVFMHANPALMEATGLTRWRDCPLAVLGPATDDLAALTGRARKENARLFLRGFELRTADAPLRCDVAVSPMAQGVLLELHALAPHETGSSSPRISQSLRGLAHEIKNPLAGVRGAAQLLSRRLADPDLRRLADLVIGEADRLAVLADRLLRPGGKPHLSAVNLHEVAERARALIAAGADPELHLDRDYDPSLPVFRGDADRMLQLVLNLMRNAVQASARTVTLRTRAEHRAIVAGQPVRTALRMDVVDDGTGVADSLRETLFLPLVSGRDEGTGLGLALAQEIAQEHGGQIAYHSRPGRTVFTLMLPLEQSNG